MPVDRRRSLEGLTRCLRCHRHIQAAETPSQTRCPFCDTSGALRIVRSTALAGLLGLAGCGSVDPATNQQDDFTQAPDNEQVDIYGAPPSTSPADDSANAEAEPEEPVAEEPTASADDVTSSDDAADNEAAEDTFEEEPPQKMRPVARYGRIPIRRQR